MMDQSHLELARCLDLRRSAHVKAALEIAFKLGAASDEPDPPVEMADFPDLRDAWEFGQLHAMDEKAFDLGYQMPHATEVPEHLRSPSLATQFRSGQETRRRFREPRAAGRRDGALLEDRRDRRPECGALRAA